MKHSHTFEITSHSYYVMSFMASLHRKEKVKVQHYVSLTYELIGWKALDHSAAVLLSVLRGGVIPHSQILHSFKSLMKPLHFRQLLILY